MIEPIKLYVHKDHIAPGMSYTTFLFPFWGLGGNKETNLYLSRALRHGIDSKYFQLVDSPQHTDYVLVPHEYFRLKSGRPDILQKIIEDSKILGKPLLIDATGDVHGKIKIPNSVILRYNQYRFELAPNELKVPVLCEDLLESYCEGKLSLRSKSDIPVVGFVGWASFPPIQMLRSYLRSVPIRVQTLMQSQKKAKLKGVFWRKRANHIFKKSHKIKTNFIVRNSFSGHTATLAGDKEKNRHEFVENILDSDYSLVVRGDANEATRFYEVLSLGRIPVLIDTSLVLPLENELNYKKFCVIIDSSDLNRAPDMLAEFHANLSSDAYLEMQKQARDAFEHYLRYDAFSPYLARMLREKLN